MEGGVDDVLWQGLRFDVERVPALLSHGGYRRRRGLLGGGTLAVLAPAVLAFVMDTRLAICFSLVLGRQANLCGRSRELTRAGDPIRKASSRVVRLSRLPRGERTAQGAAPDVRDCRPQCSRHARPDRGARSAVVLLDAQGVVQALSPAMNALIPALDKGRQLTLVMRDPDLIGAMEQVSSQGERRVIELVERVPVEAHLSDPYRGVADCGRASLPAADLRGSQRAAGHRAHAGRFRRQCQP